MTGLVVTLTRAFAATPERVFDAWLDPAQARRFLFATPDGEMTKVDIDPRVGGDALIVERRGDKEALHRLRYEVIDRPHRLVFLFKACIAGGPVADEWTRVTVAIEAEGQGARLTLTHEGVWPDFKDKTREGWTMILASLATILESDHG
ncbi:SRPBCC family protein [Hephaestia mangrovi]|uniref:SRPBCC family protein n=1 Tax=Hephaestia mangrovi TaxID=2873268 RepID=UPI001CA72B13|nr:SRPBCC domain-containing protein [Hephaestia mangrovi]MBY8828037.1 SRPBCC domain-containing protein [Hephaestia mangrovi]